MSMTFYGYFRSSSAYRVRIALNLKGLRPDCVYVHLRKGEQQEAPYREVNAQGLVPALEAGGLVLTQSLAIIEWLDETQPGPRLLPDAPDLRARVRAFAQVIACDIQPLQNLRVLRYLKNELGQEQAGLDAWCRHWVGAGLAACEAMAESGEARFLFGDRPELAECCLVPQMFAAERFGVDLAAMPRLREVTAACEAMEEFAAAHPARQPDAE